MKRWLGAPMLAAALVGVSACAETSPTGARDGDVPISAAVQAEAAPVHMGIDLAGDPAYLDARGLAAPPWRVPSPAPAADGEAGDADAAGLTGVASTASAVPESAYDVTRLPTSTSVLFTFEGLENHASPTAAREFAAWTAFPDWLAHIDLDACGDCTGKFANEPSPSTALFWNFSGATPSLEPTSREIVFERPVARAELYYAANLKVTTNSGRRGGTTITIPHIRLAAFNEAGVVIDSMIGADNFDRGTGDPTGPYSRWDVLEVTAGGTDNLIHKVSLTGFEDQVGVDNLAFVIVNFAPVSKPGGPYEGDEGAAVQFDGSVSFDPVDATGLPKPGADAVTYLWQFGDGDASTEAKPQHTYENSGDYVATLIVTDPNTVADTASVPVTVRNVAPTVDAGAAASVSYGDTYDLSATFSDRVSVDGPWAYVIDWGDGSAVESGSTSTPGGPITAPHVFETVGAYTVAVSITDADGGTGTGTVAVTVVNQPPTAAVSAASGADEGVVVAFDGSGSTDPEGDALTFAWDFGDGTTSTAASPNHPFADQGSYDVSLTVTDALGSTASASHTIEVANTAPTASFAAGAASVPEGSTFELALSGADDASAVDVAAGFTYAFDCGDGLGEYSAENTATCSTADEASLAVRGSVRDKDGGETTYTADVTVTGVAPTVDAGPDLGIGEDASLGYAGAFTDPGAADGPWSWTIDWGDGSASETGSAASISAAVTASHVYADPGTYTLTLAVTDKDGLTGTDAAAITVRQGNRAPAADAGGPYSGGEGQSIAFDGVGSSDPDGDALAYEWSFSDGGTASGATPVHTFVDDGTYTASLTVRDPSGEESSATATVSVSNAEPVVDAGGSLSGLTGEALTLSAGFDDAGAADGPWSYVVAWGDGTETTGTAASIGDIAAAKSYAEAGTYTVTVSVTDADGGTGTANTMAVVGAPNGAPTADAGGPYTAQEGADVAFDGSGSTDPDGDALSYAWDFGDGHTATGVAPVHAYEDDGSYAASLTVTDPAGATHIATTTATVTNAPPVVDAGGDAGATVGVTFSFAGAFTDAGLADSPWQWSLEWGDGATSTGAASAVGQVTAAHVYVEEGTYTVRLTVLDVDGGSGSDTREVAVQRGNAAPTADAGGPYAGSEGAAIAFDGSGSTDPDGDALSYAWDFGDGGTATGVSATHVYAGEGEYDVTLTVTDAQGASASETTTATVGDTPLAADAGEDSEPESGLELDFVGGFEDDAGDGPWSWTVEWGDGSSTSGTTPSPAEPIGAGHVYYEPGSYTLRLTVADAAGREDSSLRLVTVVPLDIGGAGLIDIHPGSGENPVNLKKRGAIPVAVFSGDVGGAFFDATQVEWSTLRFGPAGAMERHRRIHVEPKNGDAHPDIVTHFDQPESGIECGQTEAWLTGTTSTGIHFAGADVIRTICGSDWNPGGVRIDDGDEDDEDEDEDDRGKRRLRPVRGGNGTPPAH